MFFIKNGKLMMYDIEKEYKDYLRKYDEKVSLKENRKFYGVLVSNGKVDYYVPFTSKVEKRTSSKLTINVKDKNQVIAKLLLNNMIPVNMENAKLVDVEKEIYKDYYNKEISYLHNQKIKDEMIRKINNMYSVLENETAQDYPFFKKLCCDFKLLEEKCKEWRKNLTFYVKYGKI